MIFVFRAKTETEAHIFMSEIYSKFNFEIQVSNPIQWFIELKNGIIFKAVFTDEGFDKVTRGVTEVFEVNSYRH